MKNKKAACRGDGRKTGKLEVLVLLGRIVVLLSDLGSPVPDIGSSAVDDGGCPEKLRAEETGVNELSASELRQSEPEDEHGLEDVVKGDPVDERVRKEFDNLDETEDGPIGQPLLVVLRGWGLDSLEGGIGRVDPADQVGQEVTGQVEEDGDEQGGGSAQNEGDLGNLDLVLNLVEPRVLAELLVELAVVNSQLGVDLVHLRHGCVV